MHAVHAGGMRGEPEIHAGAVIFTSSRFFRCGDSAADSLVMEPRPSGMSATVRLTVRSTLRWVAPRFITLVAFAAIGRVRASLTDDCAMMGGYKNKTDAVVLERYCCGYRDVVCGVIVATNG